MNITKCGAKEGSGVNIHSLRFKLFTYFLILICVPLLVVSFFSYKKSTAIIEDKVGESVETTLLMVEQGIETVLEESRFAVTPFLVNNSHREFLRRTIDTSNYDDFARINAIMDELNAMRKSGHSIYSISLYNVKNRMLLTSEKTMHVYPNEEMLHIERLVAEEADSPRWFLEKWPVFFYVTRPTNYITYPILLDPSGGADDNTVLFVHVSESTISDYIKRLNRNDHGTTLFVLTGDGRSLVHNPAEGDSLSSVRFGEKPAVFDRLGRVFEEAQGRFTDNVDGSERFVVFHTSAATGFKYVAFVPKEDWTREINRLRNDIVLAALVMVAAAMLLAYFFMKSIYKPMFRLLKAMKQTVGKTDFDYQIEERRKDEFGVVFAGFNAMVRNIQQLVKNLYQEKLLKQEFELKLMQSQMNPHFLYNTLNSIYSVAKLHGVREVTEMAYALSHFFRHSLKGGDWISVREMLEHIEYYLKIQSIRYRDKFDWTIDVEDELMDLPILKLLLQPLVENAIIHGIEMKEGKGTIAIHGYRLDSAVVFAVSDDGLGMDEDRLQMIREQLGAGVQSSELFALSNVNMRIKHYYGEEYGLEIFSERGKGTTIQVVLPPDFGRNEHVQPDYR